MSYRVLSHTADTGIEATGISFENVLEELATGMFATVADVKPCRVEHDVVVSVTSPTREDLVVDLLSELLYRAEVDDVLFCAFQVTRLDGLEVEMSAGGVDAQSIELRGAPIKAVTYHDLDVAERSGAWFVRVYFDV
ncbi:MAG: archease [Acidimicrobiia bacterium]|nr:archease [Acidimicrobiia bacterium]